MLKLEIARYYPDSNLKPSTDLIKDEMHILRDTVHFNDAVHFRDEGNRAMATRAANGLLASPEFEALPYSNPRALAAGA